MTEACCSVARALRARIDQLEVRNEQLLQQLQEQERLTPPWDWQLTEQEAIVACLLHKGPARKTAILAAFDAERPSQDGRGDNHVSVVLRRLRLKLADFGWIIPTCRDSAYAILPKQHAAYRDAFDGGATAYPAQARRSNKSRVPGVSNAHQA